jgi:(p)ppGpp synthase/HD superfamily hydrolase
MTRLTARFEEALSYAFRLHQGQFRKGTETPYVSHLMAVAALVLENGGDEDQAIAALLHDGPEDQGGVETLEEIRQKFGAHVADIVDALSDTFETPKPPWRARKEAYLLHLEEASPEILLVSLADKLHNARTILSDLRQFGDPIWERFRGGKEGSLWYYRSLVNCFHRLLPSPLADELDAVVSAIEQTGS